MFSRLTKVSYLFEVWIFPFVSLTSYTYEDTKQIAEHIQEKTVYRPTLGIICGSGLGGLVDQVEEPFILSYTEIPGFPVSTGNIIYNLIILILKLQITQLNLDAP